MRAIITGLVLVAGGLIKMACGGKSPSVQSSFQNGEKVTRETPDGFTEGGTIDLTQSAYCDASSVYVRAYKGMPWKGSGCIPADKLQKLVEGQTDDWDPRCAPLDYHLPSPPRPEEADRACAGFLQAQRDIAEKKLKSNILCEYLDQVDKCIGQKDSYFCGYTNALRQELDTNHKELMETLRHMSM